MLRRALPLACLVPALLPAAAGARVPIRVGVGDQQAAIFDQPAFRDAHFRLVRYFIPYNAMDHPEQLERAQAFVERARMDGFDVLLHLSTDDFTARRAKLPSVAAYRAQVARLVPYFMALGVREFGAWNEANHVSQPTWDHPARAAAFFHELRQAVVARCTVCSVVALDVLDVSDAGDYVAAFYAALSPYDRRRAAIVGIHNYGDVNRLRAPHTGAIIRAVRRVNPRARFWFTETGGIVKFGRAFPCSPVRAAIRLATMFQLARRFRAQGVERVYVYNWSGAGCDARFDAGLTDPDGTPRPGYRVLRRELALFER